MRTVYLRISQDFECRDSTSESYKPSSNCTRLVSYRLVFALVSLDLSAAQHVLLKVSDF